MDNNAANSKRVYILIFTGADYGSQLQYYALFNTIKSLGYKPVCTAWKLNYLRTSIRTINRFRVFSNTHINLYESCYSQKELQNSITDNSIVIIAGKQNFKKWGWIKSPGAPFMRYFADFASGKKTLISLSARFNLADLQDDNHIFSECKKLLQRFDRLSVNNKSDADILQQHMLINPEQLHDPVFLLPGDSYECLFNKEYLPYADDNKTYIAYMLSDDIWGLNISQINLAGELIFNINTNRWGSDFNSVGAWLFYIKNAKFVVSDYFHCIAFAILYKKPFIALVDKDINDNDITELLSNLNLKHLMKSSLEEIDEQDLKAPIDWHYVDQVIHEMGKKSLTFLKNALREKPEFKSPYKNNMLEKIRIKKGKEYLGQIFPIYERILLKKQVETKRRLLRILVKLLVNKRKYKKLKKDYKLFFKDSKSRIIKSIGKYYQKDAYTVDILRKPRLEDYSGDIKKTISLFYHASGFNNKYNVGDLLSKYIVEKLSDKKVLWTGPDNPNKLCALGTILSDGWINSGGHFWGSGYGGVSITEKALLSKNSINFYAVRGPISRNFVKSRGISCPDVYGDPALLLPEFYDCNKAKKYKIGLICHYTHGHIFNYDEGVLLIDIMRSPDDMLSIIDDICQCEMILSSSLHGIIIANAYGIPARWFVLNGFALQAYPKYHDYFLSVKMPVQEPLVFDENTIIRQDMIKADKTVDLKIDLRRLKESFPYELHN